jgi:hypothetical protein
MVEHDIEVEDSAEAVLDEFVKRQWCDGLPIVPPTEDRVARMLGGRDGTRSLGAFAPMWRQATLEKLAINAVMAGCEPSYFPIVVAAVEAMLDPAFNLYGVQATTHPVAPLVVVNGPYGKSVGVHGGQGCFGPGFRANATIGRALRLVIRNVCRAIPGVLDRATFSNPMRYSFCFGEEEEDNPWTPLHVERGFAREDSAVTVASVFYLLPATDFTSRTPEKLCDTYLALLRRQHVAGDRWLGEGNNAVLVIGREHRRYFQRAGWSKDAIRDYLWPRCFDGSTNVVGLGRKEGLLIFAAGGDGMAESWILFPHLAWAITEKVVWPSRGN